MADITKSDLKGTRKSFFASLGGFEGTEITTPSNPSTGKRRIYPKSDAWYGLDSAGNEVKFSIVGHTHTGVYEPANANIQAHISAASPHSGHVVSNAGIAGATKTKITYDAKGLVTSGADATTADIAASTNKNYVTDAQLTVIGNTSGTNTGDQVVPANEAGASNNFLTAYNSTTGAWTKARPTWANVDKTTSDIADIATKSHTSLTDKGTNTHAQIDTFISSKAAASGLASLNASSKVVQDCANAQTPAAHTQAASTITPGTFGGAVGSYYYFPGAVFFNPPNSDGHTTGGFVLVSQGTNPSITFSGYDLAFAFTISHSSDGIFYFGNTGTGVLHLNSDGYITAGAGFRVNGVATAGKYLRGDGTNCVLDDVKEIKESGGQVLTFGAIADGQIFKRSGTTAIGTVFPKQKMTFTFDGGSSAVAAHAIVIQSVPVTGTITKWRVTEVTEGGVAGTCAFDLWMDTYANFQPTVADTLNSGGATMPGIASSGIKAEGTTFTNWRTTSVTEGDEIVAHLDSNATCKKLVLEIWIQP